MSMRVVVDSVSSNTEFYLSAIQHSLPEIEACSRHARKISANPDLLSGATFLIDPQGRDEEGFQRAVKDAFSAGADFIVVPALEDVSLDTGVGEFAKLMQMFPGFTVGNPIEELKRVGHLLTDNNPINEVRAPVDWWKNW